jgi:hypothetical protein
VTRAFVGSLFGLFAFGFLFYGLAKPGADPRQKHDQTTPIFLVLAIAFVLAAVFCFIA